MSRIEVMGRISHRVLLRGCWAQNFEFQMCAGSNPVISSYCIRIIYIMTNIFTTSYSNATDLMRAQISVNC
ncbi:MAG: hypothetical protein CM15mP21_7900 [Hyphomicrobiales bacterium]|nr:MAG: hypothetical protein CM15mP21_7900 [Hyphomicrobiales bacterium]